MGSLPHDDRSSTRGEGVSRPPVALLVLAVAGAAFVVLPFAALLVEVRWSTLPGTLSGPFALDALWLSAVTSISAALLSAVLGVPLGWLLARADFSGKALLRGLVLLPLVLPPVVGGTVLLFAMGRRGLIGGPLYEATGLVLPFSLGGTILAATFVSMPFLVVTVEGALRNLDPRFEAAAATLGASSWRVATRVTLPMIRPALVSGLLLTWARALGEFGATLTFAGNLPGRTQTLPLAIYVALDGDREVATALSLLMVVVSLTVLVTLRDRWWRAL